MTPGTADPASLPPAEVRAMLEASRDATRIAEALASAARADLRQTLTQLTMPVSAIWGDRDRIVRHSELGLPTARIPGAGHIPMMERPAEFAAALKHLLVTPSPPVAPSLRGDGASG
jgi:pimeloyl-ACP methyl ester carboxylesterase